MFGPSSELLCRTSVASPWGYHCYGRTASTAQPVFLAQLDNGINESKIGENSKGFECLGPSHLYPFVVCPPFVQIKKIAPCLSAKFWRSVHCLGRKNCSGSLRDNGSSKGSHQLGVHARYIIKGSKCFKVCDCSVVCCLASCSLGSLSNHFAPNAASKVTSTGRPHVRLLACSNVLAQDDAQCSTALFEPCSENFLSRDTRCAGKKNLSRMDKITNRRSPPKTSSATATNCFSSKVTNVNNCNK